MLQVSRLLFSGWTMFHFVVTFCTLISSSAQRLVIPHQPGGLAEFSPNKTRPSLLGSLRLMSRGLREAAERKQRGSNVTCACCRRRWAARWAPRPSTPPWTTTSAASPTRCTEAWRGWTTTWCPGRAWSHAPSVSLTSWSHSVASNGFVSRRGGNSDSRKTLRHWLILVVALCLSGWVWRKNSS